MPQIERLTDRYRLEYARHDATARSVEDKLRRVLGRARVTALITSRAKDSESVRGSFSERERWKSWQSTPVRGWKLTSVQWSQTSLASDVESVGARGHAGGALAEGFGFCGVA
jgi:regulator of protease activity HflC (stomatin/prohibitin superfamily)